MEASLALLAVAGAVAVVLAAALLYRLRGRRRRHKMTVAGLRQRALEESEALMALIREREAARGPAGADSAGVDPDEALRRANAHDEELRLAYRGVHLPRVADLREQFAERGIRDEALDEVYGSVRSEAEARTVSTALLVMADRLRQAFGR